MEDVVWESLKETWKEIQQANEQKKTAAKEAVVNEIRTMIKESGLPGITQERLEKTLLPKVGEDQTEYTQLVESCLAAVAEEQKYFGTTTSPVTLEKLQESSKIERWVNGEESPLPTHQITEWSKKDHESQQNPVQSAMDQIFLSESQYHEPNFGEFADKFYEAMQNYGVRKQESEYTDKASGDRLEESCRSQVSNKAKYLAFGINPEAATQEELDRVDRLDAMFEKWVGGGE